MSDGRGRGSSVRGRGSGREEGEKQDKGKNRAIEYPSELKVLEEAPAKPRPWGWEGVRPESEQGLEVRRGQHVSPKQAAGDLPCEPYKSSEVVHKVGGRSLSEL